MRAENIEKLRIAANQFYLNKYMDQPITPDSEYDKLVKEYEAEGGSVIDLVEWEDARRSHTPLPKVEKEVVGDNDLQGAVIRYIKRTSNPDSFYCYLNYKYDGSSIIAYYDEKGKLKMILGTPDCDVCMDRTRNCWNIFPHKVNPGIECIQGEFLVDAGQYGQLARNKANGLLNSKDMIADLENEGFVRVYQMRFYDGNWSLDRLNEELDNLPVIESSRIRNGVRCLDKVFARAEVLSAAPSESIIQEHDMGYTPVQFQVDGAVIYSTLGYHAFKFYYTEYAETTVKCIEWNRQLNGSFIPKIIIEPVQLNGKWIGQVASGGVNNMIGMKMGRGAKVKVILSGLTIPKIIQTITASEDYQWPTCGCGYVFSEKDVFGGGVKCGNTNLCHDRYNMWKSMFDFQWNNRKGEELTMTRKEWIKVSFMDKLNWALNIDRTNLCKFDNDEFRESLILALFSNDPDEFLRLLESRIPYGLAHDILMINITTGYCVLHDFITE